jgi:Zn-dependent protease
MHFTPDQIRWTIIYVFLLVISTAFHEFGHAFVADWLGDDTPRRQGRVTLNPLAHADPIGTIAMPLVAGLFGGIGGFGWGKPVQWQPSRVRRSFSMATAQVLVSIAGPAMNLMLALLTSLVHVILIWRGVLHRNGLIDSILMRGVWLNMLLLFFNMLPVPPLDGRSLVQWLLPYRHRGHYENLERFGPFIIAAMMFTRLSLLFTTPTGWCVHGLYSMWGSVFGIHDAIAEMVRQMFGA